MPWFHFAQAVVKRMKKVGLTFLLSVRLSACMSLCNVHELWSHIFSAINNYFQWSTTNFVKEKFWLSAFWLSILASLAFSTPVFWCHDFHSRVFQPCFLVPRIPLPPFPLLHFWRSRVFHSRVFSRPTYANVHYGDMCKIMVDYDDMRDTIDLLSCGSRRNHLPGKALCWMHDILKRICGLGAWISPADATAMIERPQISWILSNANWTVWLFANVVLDQMLLDKIQTISHVMWIFVLMHIGAALLAIGSCGILWWKRRNTMPYIMPRDTIRYDIDLRALKSWRDGQLNLAHGPETKNNEKNKNQKPSSSEESSSKDAASYLVWTPL